MRRALQADPKPVILRGPSGLGDAVYLRPVAEYLARSARVTVLSSYPDVFRDSGVEEVKPFSRTGPIDIVAHYAHDRANPGTNQWQDMCSSAHIPTIPFRFAWRVTNTLLVGEVQELAAGRPIVIVHGGQQPMDRLDGVGIELRPAKAAFDAALAALDDCFRVRVGKVCRTGEGYPLQTDLDLREKTSVSDLLDLAWICSGWLAQCSLAVPMAEAFGKPLLALWGAGIKNARQSFIRQLTPQKVLSAPTSRYAMDDLAPPAIEAGVRIFRMGL